MQIAARYPLAKDLGYPNGVRAARQRWVKEARRRRWWVRTGPVIAGLVLTMVFSFFGIMPWLIRRAVNPRELASHMSSEMPMGNAHLGAEYYNIASALVQGRGFSDPFPMETGATAWMPPLLVWIQAGLIQLFDGDRFYVMLVVVLMKTVVLCGCAALVASQGMASRTGWFGFGVIAAYFIAECYSGFAFTHDSWLILACVTGTLVGLSWVQRSITAGNWTLSKTLGWGAFGGLAALASPVAGFAWAVGTTIAMVRQQTAMWLVAACVSIVAVTPWAIRNKIVLGKFVPIKSNVFFEFDQSLAVDSDGLLDWSTFKLHPYHAGEEQDAYKEMGEIAYLETKRQRFLSQLAASPGEFRRKVRNRLIATTLLPIGFSDYKMGSCQLPLRWLIYPLPMLAIVFLLFAARPLRPLQRWAIILYFAYLFPYILCSYYPRYGFPLLTIKMLLCFWAIEEIVRRVRRERFAIG